MKLLLAGLVTVVFASPAFAGEGSTQTDTQVQHKTETHNRSTTHYHDVTRDDYHTRTHDVTGSPIIDRHIHKHITDVTVQPVVHEHDVTRVHPVHHIEDITRVLHHHKRVDQNEYATHRHVAPERVEHVASEVMGKGRTIVTHKRIDLDP